MRRVVAVALPLILVGLLVWIAGIDREPAPGSADPAERSPGSAELTRSPATAAGASGSLSGAVILGQVRRGGLPRVARVELREASPVDPMRKALATTVSGPDGRFVFDGLEPGSFEIRVREGEGWRGGASATVEFPDQHVRADVVLADGPHDLRGVAAHRDGRAFRGTLEVRDAA